MSVLCFGEYGGEKKVHAYSLEIFVQHFQPNEQPDSGGKPSGEETHALKIAPKLRPKTVSHPIQKVL